MLHQVAAGPWTAPDTTNVAPRPPPTRVDERELAGRTLVDRYDLLALLGAGGMGAVYRAYDRELDELVALKVIKADLARQPVMIEQFRHEVKLARRVTHTNVARTFELGHTDGIMYCTMELIDGESLHARLLRERKLPTCEAAMIASALCDGLAAAHAAGVIHRDIKPANVLLARDGRVVLADLGVSLVAAEADEGLLTGTPAYMAPEQARGEPPTPATDVYAVGVLLFEMVTGLRAFSDGMSGVLVAKQDLPRLEVPPGSAPPEIAEVIGRATAREPADRVATAAELRRLLEGWRREGPDLSAPPVPLVEARELRTVVVVPPSGDDARLHLAAGVHEELLRRLVRRPHLRVLPRADGGPVPNAMVVELVAGDMLSVTIRCHVGQTALHLPLDVASIELSADVIASAVAETYGRADEDPTGERSEARELQLRARMILQRDTGGAQRAVTLLERAYELCPDDPRIAATLAMLHLRFFVTGPGGHDSLDRSRTLVGATLAAAPDLPEAHVAAGQLELHTGEPVVAASHYRTAIACSPYSAEAHEGLGRMLLEAGFLDVAMARIEDARAIAPDLGSIRWEIARAHALERDWAAYDALVATLTGQRDLAVARLRVAWWRGDRDQMIAAYRQIDSSRWFEPRLIDMLYSIAVERAWPARRDEIIGHVLGARSPSMRRRAFLAQLGAEAAGASGDVAACNTMIDFAVANGLFDLHWFEKCPLIEPARRTAQGAIAYARVKRRAEAVFDALYGDGEAQSDALSDTLAV